MQKLKSLRALISLLCLFGYPVAIAWGATWTNSTGNNLYSDSRNWSGGILPNPFDTINLPALGAGKQQIDLGGQSQIFVQLFANLMNSPGAYRIYDGTLQIGSITVSGSGGSLQIDANVIGSGTLLGVNLGNSNSPDAALFGGVIGDGSGGGAFGLNVEGATILGANTYTGATLISEQPLNLKGGGSIGHSSLVDVSGVPFMLTNSASAVDRIGDTATVSISQSSFQLLGGTERIGVLQFGGGPAGVVVQQSSTTATLHAASLQRLFSDTLTIDDTPGSASFVLDSVPSMIGGGSLPTQRAILPYAISSSGSLLTYDGTGSPSDVGLRALNAATEYLSSLSGATASSNVWLTAPSTAGSDTAIGGLVLGPNASIQISSGAKFTVNNAAVSVIGSGTSSERTIFSGDGTLVFPGEAIFHIQAAQPGAAISSPSEVVINSPIVAQSLVKSGAGSLILARSNNYTGGTHIVQGTLVCRDANALGTGSLSLSPGAQLDVEQSMTLPSMTLQDEALHISNDPADASLTIAAGKTLTVNGDLTSTNPSQDIYLLGGGTLLINGNVNGGEFWPTTETIVANGNWDANSQLRRGTLTGSGTLHGWVEPTFIKPGNGIGRMTIDSARNYILTNDGMEFEIAGNNPGVTYDQLVITQDIELNSGGAKTQLSLVISAPLTPQEQFKIIDIQSSSHVTGTFSGLPEGAIFTDDGYQFRITYSGGTGNDIVLTVLPEPTSMGIALCVMSIVLNRRRRH